MTARIAVFASGYGANFATCVRLARRRPDLLTVAMLVTDSPGCRATRLARDAGVPVLERPFAAEVGRASDCRDEADRRAYAERARRFHDGISDALAGVERRDGAFDALVFAYRRWVHGDLLDRFRGRILNQHPGDLTVLDAEGRRALVGNDPVLLALRLSLPEVRTTTFLVDDGHDEGSILAQGPALPTAGYVATREAATELEHRQKAVSDPLSLTCALLAFLGGVVRYDASRTHRDGSRALLLDGVPLPHGGIDTAALLAGETTPLRPELAALVTRELREEHDAATGAKGVRT